MTMDVWKDGISTEPEAWTRLLDAADQFGAALPACLSRSSSAMEAFESAARALAGGGLTQKERAAIALVTARKNSCSASTNYHSNRMKNLGFKDSDIQKLHQGIPDEQRTKAIVNFSNVVMYVKGHISEIDISDARQNGLSDEIIVETVFCTVIFWLENLLLNICETAFTGPP